MKYILVAGGAGFIGSNLCAELVKNKDNFVYCMDNFYTGKLKNIKKLIGFGNFLLIESDIMTYKFEPDFYVDEIYNAACPASPPAYQAKPIYTTETCILGSLNLLKLATRCGAKILQFSTSEVYGEPEVQPQIEEYRGYVNPIGIRSCYDEGKRCAESLFFDFNREYNTRIKIVRIFNTYGPNMDKNDGRVVSNFINQALEDKFLTVYGNGLQTRSFCYVSDLVDGLIKFMNSSDNIMGPINLGNPDEHTITEIISKIKNILGKELKINHLDLPKDDPTRRKPDISKAKILLGYKPKVSLDTGLLYTINYFKEEHDEFNN